MAAIRILTKKKFAWYKKVLSKKVEEKRVSGKEWMELTAFITNYIGFDNRFAFTGKQIRELLMLANEPIGENEKHE